MGMDCYGILYYGFPLEQDAGDTEFPKWAYDEDGDLDLDRWSDIYLKSIGYDETGYSFDPKRYREDADYAAEIRKIWDTRSQLLKQSGVAVARSGYDGNLVHFVFTLKVSSEWGQMIPIDMTVQPQWEDQLKKFCEVTGIPYQQPQWYLTSKWF